MRIGRKCSGSASLDVNVMVVNPITIFLINISIGGNNGSLYIIVL